MTEEKIYTTRPIAAPSLLEAVRLRAKRTGSPEAEVAKSLGEELYARWLSEKLQVEKA